MYIKGFDAVFMLRKTATLKRLMLPSDMRTRNLKKHLYFSAFMSFEKRVGC